MLSLFKNQKAQKDEAKQSCARLCKVLDTLDARGGGELRNCGGSAWVLNWMQLWPDCPAQGTWTRS